MNDLSPALKRAIEQAVATDPKTSADEFMREIGSAVTDTDGREAIRSTWLRASVLLAEAEGGNLTGEEVFGPVLKRLRARADNEIG